MIIDSHAHLDCLREDELRAGLARAEIEGVGLILTVGMGLDSSARGITIAERFEHVYAAVGLHPWLAQNYPDGPPLAALHTLARNPRVIAIGEIGLDFVDNMALGLSYDDPALRAIQERAFRAQIGLARDLELPLIIHSRGSHERLLAILEEETAQELGGCIQFFEGDLVTARRFADLGFLLSLGSRITHLGDEQWTVLVRDLPEAALILETDTPWTPVPGKPDGRSEPADLLSIARAVAAARGIDLRHLLDRTEQNFMRVFGPVLADSSRTVPNRNNLTE